MPSCNTETPQTLVLFRPALPAVPLTFTSLLSHMSLPAPAALTPLALLFPLRLLPRRKASAVARFASLCAAQTNTHLFVRSSLPLLVSNSVDVAFSSLTVLIVVYFVGGALFLKFARGAEGMDIIPNREFWSDLPTLCKDGIMFIVNKIRGGPSSYETVA